MEGMAADESLGAVVALQQQQRWLQYSPVLTGSEFSATSSVPHAQFPNQKALGSIPGSSSDAFQSQQMSRSYDNSNHPFYQRLLSSLDSTLASPDPLLYSSASNSLSSLYSSPTIRKDREEHQHAISNMRSSSLYPFAVNKANILLEDCSFDQSFHISLSSMKVPSCSQADHSVAQNISICAPLAGKVVNPSNDTGPQQVFVSSSVSAPLAGKVVSRSNDTGPQQVFASSSVSAPEKKASSPDPTADSFTNSIHQISRKRKVQQKRIVCVPLTTGTGRASGEGLSTADTWSWRKYGQKPIKGSPYPRGYYRCSSYKGCPARKQVERSRTDPSMLIIAYSSDHNHSSPARRAASHQSPLTMANDQLTVTSSDHEEAAATASGHPSEALFCSIINSNSSKDSSCDEAGMMSTMKTAINPELPVFNNQDCTGDLKKMNVSSGSCSSCNMSTQAEEDNFFSELEELPDSSEIFGSVQLLNDGSAAQDHEASGRQLAATDHLYNLLCWSSACSSSI